MKKFIKLLPPLLPMEQEIITLLREYGLKDEEIRIYTFLVGNNELSAYKIAKELRIPKSSCYDLLWRLIEKGFVSKIDKEGKMIFSANELNRVIGGLKEKESILLELIPKIKNMEKEEETKIKLLDKPSSQKEFNIRIVDLAREKKITYFYCASNGPSEINHEINSLNMLIERLVAEVTKRNLFKKIDYKGIWDEKFRRSNFLKIFNKLGKNKYLNLPTKATTIIFDGYVVFLYSDSSPKVVEIKNREISEEMKSYFLHLWKIAQD